MLLVLAAAGAYAQDDKRTIVPFDGTKPAPAPFANPSVPACPSRPAVVVTDGKGNYWWTDAPGDKKECKQTP